MQAQLEVTPPDIAGPIIAKFGGETNMAKLTGHPRKRVEGWARNRQIPEKWRPWLLAVARREGIPHTPLDYVEHLISNPIAA